MKNDKTKKSAVGQGLENIEVPEDNGITEETNAMKDESLNSDMVSDEVAARIGRAVIEQLTLSGELDSSSAAELLLGRYTDNSTTGLAALSAKAANDLVRLSESGELNRKIDDYIADPEFVELLYSMPTHAAVKIYDLQKDSHKASKNDADAIAKAEQSIIERLLMRKSLPASTKSTVSASPDTDYANMSSEQFRELSKRLKRAASNGMKVKI